MKEKIKKRISLYISILVLFVIVNIVVSFAYLRGRANGNESVSTIAIEGVGTINVAYSSNTPDIIMGDILPGYETIKDVSVTSNISSGSEIYKRGIWYQIRLVVDTNEFLTGSLAYSLSLADTSSTDGITALPVDKIGIPNGANQDGILVGTGYFSNDNVTHTYNLKISYVNMEEVDQSSDYQSKFAAHVIITNPEYINLTFNLDGGSFDTLALNSSSTMKVASNSIINLPIPIKNGFTFAGWEIVGGNVSVNNNAISTNDSDITLKALLVPSAPYEFAYTGGEQEFIVELSGYYKLEVWGAQGGSYNETYYGGYGGYSTGEMQLNKDEMIYIYVGGTTSDITGGYNGGGGTGSYGKGGGGATHISKVNGELSSLSQYAQNNQSPILIVSGGGGGAYYENFANVEFFGNIGGNSGGYIGGRGVSSSRNTSYGGTQTSGGKCADSSELSGNFGKGGIGPSFSAGGGGGYYGGAAGGTDRSNGGDYGTGGGGSSYIGNSLLTDKYMYCYNCDTSDVESTKTYTTTCAEETPTADCAKIGNGYARITYLHS